MTTEQTETNEEHECEECHRNYPTEEVHQCADCDSVLVCDGCARHNTDNAPVCESCGEDYYSCEECDRIVTADNSHFADERMWCETCFDRNYETCCDCGNNTPISTNVQDDNTTVCISCFENNGWSTCDACNELSQNLSYCESCDGYYCNSCTNEDHDHGDSEDEEIDLDDHARGLIAHGADAITDYHPSVNWPFKTDKNDILSAPYFGVELEIETGDCASDACNVVGKTLKGNCLCSHDGSLQDGFEIVFAPHKYEAFRKLKMPLVLKELSRVGATSHEKGTCGLHVHIQRTPFLKKDLNYLALKKLEERTQRYPRTNADMFQYMFNAMHAPLLSFSQRNHEKMSYCNFNHGGKRYSAVNLQNKATIEIRLWRGTLEPERFRASIKMSLALLEFMQATSNVTILSNHPFRLTEAFKAFLLRRDEYQSLVKHLSNKGLFGLGHTGKRPRLKLKRTVLQAFSTF